MSDDAKLRFTTLALRRDARQSDHVELSPVVLRRRRCRTASEDRAARRARARAVRAADEARPATVARLLLPDGVRLEEVEVELAPRRAARAARRGRTDRRSRSSSCPSRATARAPSGHWVFVPVLDHACFVVAQARTSRRALAAELAVLPAALALDLDGWSRLMTWAPARLEPIDVELATTPLAQAKGRKALAEAERKRQARASRSTAPAGALEPPDPPRRSSAATSSSRELARALDACRRGAACCSSATRPPASRALVDAWARREPGRARSGRRRRAS